MIPQMPFLPQNYSYQPSYPNYNQPIQATRYVNNFNEINANDVPMDGRYTLFIKNDLSEVQAKAWGNDGRINTISYVPKLTTTPINLEQNSNVNEKTDKLSSETQNAKLEEINNTVIDIQSRLSNLEKSLTKKKKEVNENE